MHFSIFACESSSFFKDILLLPNSQMASLWKIKIDNKKYAYSKKARIQQRVKHYYVEQYLEHSSGYTNFTIARVTLPLF